MRSRDPSLVISRLDVLVHMHGRLARRLAFSPAAQAR